MAQVVMPALGAVLFVVTALADVDRGKRGTKAAFILFAVAALCYLALPRFTALPRHHALNVTRVMLGGFAIGNGTTLALTGSFRIFRRERRSQPDAVVETGRSGRSGQGPA